MKKFLRPLIDLSYLLIPNQCSLCGMMLVDGEQVICLPCLFQLPRTGFVKQRDHPAAMAFWGRFDFRHVSASFYYRRANPVQKLIHNLKYHGDREAGVFLGQLLGSELKMLTDGEPNNLLVPVPLHPKKEKIRGYNQSSLICSGIAQITGWKISEKLLYRVSNRESQTRKNRFNRWENAEGLYRVSAEYKPESAHIWIIDDVITTGSTLEACALALSKSGCSGLSAAAVAFSGR